jgi:hypothetical protein
MARLDAIEAAFDGVRLALDGLDTNRTLVYGDTPTWALVELFADVGLEPDDVFYDLGCGSGRLVLAASLFCRRAVGIELLAERVRPGLEAAAALGLAGVELRTEDMTRAEVSDGTFFFSYWTTFPPEVRRAAASRVAAAPAGARLITVGQPMEHPRIELVRREERLWGLASDLGGEWRTPVFIQRLGP